MTRPDERARRIAAAMHHRIDRRIAMRMRDVLVWSGVGPVPYPGAGRVVVATGRAFGRRRLQRSLAGTLAIRARLAVAMLDPARALVLAELEDGATRRIMAGCDALLAAGLGRQGKVDP